MTGPARANLFVSRISGMAAGVAHRGGEDAVTELPELALRAPEAAKPEHRLRHALRKRRLELTAVDEMAVGGGDRVRTAGQRLGRARQCGGLAHEQHGLVPGWISGE